MKLKNKNIYIVPTRKLIKKLIWRVRVIYQYLGCLKRLVKQVKAINKTTAKYK